MRDHVVPTQSNIPAYVDDVADPTTPNIERGYSQAAQVMAVNAGLLPASTARADLEYVFQPQGGAPPAGGDRWNDPTYLFRALDALSTVRLSELALQHLLDCFSPYLPGDAQNLTPRLLQGKDGDPLPEYWVTHQDLTLPLGVAAPTQPLDASGSYGWNAVGLVWLHKRLLGVMIAQPGGSVLDIQPDAAGFSHIEGTAMIPQGRGQRLLDAGQIDPDHQAALTGPRQRRPPPWARIDRELARPRRALHLPAER